MAKLIHDYAGMRDGTKASVGGKPKCQRVGQTYALGWAWLPKAAQRSVFRLTAKPVTFGIR